MLDISLIMLGAGDSSRFKMPTKKQWLRIANEPLWLYASKNLAKMLPFEKNHNRRQRKRNSLYEAF